MAVVAVAAVAAAAPAVVVFVVVVVVVVVVVEDVAAELHVRKSSVHQLALRSLNPKTPKP